MNSPLLPGKIVTLTHSNLLVFVLVSFLWRMLPECAKISQSRHFIAIISNCRKAYSLAKFLPAARIGQSLIGQSRKV